MSNTQTNTTENAPIAEKILYHGAADLLAWEHMGNGGAGFESEAIGKAIANIRNRSPEAKKLRKDALRRRLRGGSVGEMLQQLAEEQAFDCDDWNLAVEALEDYVNEA